MTAEIQLVAANNVPFPTLELGPSKRAIEARLGCEAASELVLPDRIELSTSPLPRGCSTTELRQRKKVGPVRAPAGNVAEIATRR